MNIAALLSPIVQAYPQRPAISTATDLYRSYRDLGRSIACLAGALRHRLHMRPGERVGIAMSNCAAYLETMLSVWHAGLVVVPVNAKLHPKEIEYILGNSGVRLCFTNSELAGSIAPLVDTVDSLERVISVDDPEYAALSRADPMRCADAGPDEPAWLFYTSGTTGQPKGATLTHRNLIGMTLRYHADVDFIDDRDCMIHAAPLSHASGLYALPHLVKGSHQVIPASRGFDPVELCELMRHYDMITLFAAPTMLTRLVNHPGFANARIDAIRTIFYGGAPMYVEDLKRALGVLGPRLIQIYAQGETPCTATYLPKRLHIDDGHPRYQERLASVGIARTGVEVRVVDPDDTEVARGEPGEVVCRSDVTMSGYWNNPQASAETLRGGWLHTGDVGVMDDDGFLTIKDRSKDMIISGGTNIYPREVEEVLLLHTGVLEVSVVGRPHPDWGEEVVAFVSMRPGAQVTAQQLDAICLENIARFKRPKAYHFIANLPKNSYGKVLKTELRQRTLETPQPRAR